MSLVAPDHERRHVPGQGEGHEEGRVVGIGFGLCAFGFGLGIVAPLTNTTLRLIEHLFAPDQHDAVGAVLAEECGPNLPFCETRDAVGLERIRFAVLMLSDGDINKLSAMVNQAKVDWRDVLVWAGFGYSLTAHERWAQAVLEP